MRLSLILLVSGALAAVASAADSVGRLRRHAERPPAQASTPGSTSWMSVTRSFPAGSNYIEFDYVVDSEQNDRLELFAIGFSPNPIWVASGLNLGGHARVPFTIATGASITVRFQYSKNSDSIHGGSDTAWIDSVRFISEVAGLFFHSSFAQGTLDASPAGWTSGGFSGGWVVRPAAPARSAMRPPGQTHNQQSHLEKTITFPLNSGGVDFDYFVDSQEGHDYLRFLLDGVEIDLEPGLPGIQGISGRHRQGHISVPVPTAGPHAVRFEYVKDGAGSEGLDTARVDGIRIRLAPALVEYYHDFREREGAPGGIRHQGGGPIEWSGDWVASPATPHRSYLPFQQTDQKWHPKWRSFSPPETDGLVTSEYRNPIRIVLPDYSDGAFGNKGGLLFVVAGEGLLYLGLRVPASSVAPGGEQGRLRLFLDSRHAATMGGVGGCGQGSDLPDPEDRQIDWQYNFSQVVSVSPQQVRGNCDALTPWVATDQTHPAWNILFAASEPADDAGFVHLEIRIELPQRVLDEHALGLALIRETTGPAAALERFPYVDDGTGPVAAAVSSWESLLFDYQHGHPRPTEFLWDLGAFPAPSRPGSDW